MRLYATTMSVKLSWRSGVILALSCLFVCFFYSNKELLQINHTWISWILLKPSLQKNSTRLDKVLGPGISFRLLAVLLLPPASAAAAAAADISGSAAASSPAAERPNVSLAADLCNRRAAANMCPVRVSPWALLQHAVASLLRVAMALCMEVAHSRSLSKISDRFKCGRACPRHVQRRVPPSPFSPPPSPRLLPPVW